MDFTEPGGVLAAEDISNSVGPREPFEDRHLQAEAAVGGDRVLSEGRHDGRARAREALSAFPRHGCAVENGSEGFLLTSLIRSSTLFHSGVRASRALAEQKGWRESAFVRRSQSASPSQLCALDRRRSVEAAAWFRRGTRLAQHEATSARLQIRRRETLGAPELLLPVALPRITDELVVALLLRARRGRASAGHKIELEGAETLHSGPHQPPSGRPE